MEWQRKVFVRIGAERSVPLAQVKTNAANNVCGHTFYVMDASGAAPERAAVERACQQVSIAFKPYLCSML
jgi:hypothetical protein